MNKERLLLLADFVDANVIREKFDMSRFFSCEVQKVEDLFTCGTTACLAGWACSIPEFSKLGYHAQLYNVNHPELGIIPVMNGKILFGATEELFELSHKEALYLFGEYADEEATVAREQEAPAHATKRIRDYVATGNMTWEGPDYTNGNEEV